ncbi:MAG: vWA domain-containing protein [Myxococcota bacterium]
MLRTTLQNLALRMTATLAACLFATAALHADPDPTPARVAPQGKQPLIQLAILLDTSGSMDGLIGQAKTQLWSIVNEFARARKRGQVPRLEVALYEYGNDGLSAEKGYIRQVVPLTTDLDRISEALFGLRTNGGSEWCGKVIDTAVTELQWSQDADALKTIFIAGNEPFTQGPVNFPDAIKRALKQDITVNTIHCGSEHEGVAGGWKQAALLADGRFSIIDHNKVATYVATPHDEEIARLGEQLNSTYVAYGNKGGEMKERQKKQDSNAQAAAPAAVVARSVAKSSAHYRNDGWDLVDAQKEGKVALEAMADDELPAEMKGMTPEQRKAYVAEMERKRAALQAKIRELEAKRQAYLAAQQKKGKDKDTFDAAVVESVRSGAGKKAFTFE